MLGPVWMALERRLSAAEDLGGRLAQAESEALRLARVGVDPAVREIRGSARSMAWFAGRVIGRLDGRTNRIWPPRIPLHAREPGDRDIG